MLMLNVGIGFPLLRNNCVTYDHLNYVYPRRFTIYSIYILFGFAGRIRGVCTFSDPLTLITTCSTRSTLRRAVPQLPF